MSIYPFQPWRSVFETLKVIAGQPQFVQEHFSNLCAAAKRLSLPTPPDFAARADELPPCDGRWRWVHGIHHSEVFFVAEPFIKKNLWTLEVAQVRVGSQNWEARYKTLSYLVNAQAREMATGVGADEAILLNEFSQVASGAMSNLFWVKDSVLYTPSLEAGCRAGVIREWVRQQKPVQEVLVSMEEVMEAQEVFCTNSLIGIQPVGRIGQRDFILGPITRELVSHLRD